MIDEFLIELKDAQAFEETRINGYKEILSFPSTILSSEARDDVTKAINWSTGRHNAVQRAITSIQALLENGYPDRERVIVSGNVLNELLRDLENFKLAIDELESPSSVSGALAVGNETRA